MDTEMSVWNVADFHFIFLFFRKKFKSTPPKYQVGDQHFSLIGLKLSLEEKTFYDSIKTKSYFCRLFITTSPCHGTAVENARFTGENVEFSNIFWFET